MNDETKFFLIISLNQLLESKAIIHGDKNNQRSKALSEKIGQLLEEIPELENFLDEKDINLKKKLYVEIGRYIKFSRMEKGCTIKHLGEGDKLFHMIFYGKILKLNIVYKTLYISLKEYILFLAKLLIINEKFLYADCIKKNQKLFKIKETIDIIDYGKNIKTFDFEDEIKKIKNLNDEIFLKKISEEEKMKRKLNIQELISLYNPKTEERNNYLNVEQKYNVLLPFFYVDKIIDSISFIGDLNKSHGIKKYSSYICLTNCDVFYIDKTELKDDIIFNHINSNKSDLITNNLFRKHYIFKDGDINFLQKNYSKFFSMIKIKKGENLILQNSVYDGVYFIGKGVIEIKIKRSYNDLNELKYNILNYNPNLINQNLESFRDKKRDIVIQRLLRNPQFIKEANEVKEINFGTLVDTEIIGLSDLYDKNSGIYNFSAQCISNEAELFFVPKEIFNSILTNPDIEEKISKLTTEKIKIINLKIKRFTDLFEEEFDKLSPQLKEEKKYLNVNKLNISKNLFNNSKTKSKIIPGRFKYKFTSTKYKQKKLFKSESDNMILNSKSYNHLRNINEKRPEDNTFDKYINYNKRYNIPNNNEQYTSINTIQSRNSLANISRISNESKLDEVKSIIDLYSNRVNNILLNNYKLKNKNSYYSLSLINNKPKSIDNKSIFDNNNTQIKNTKYFNKLPSNNYLKQYSQHGRNRKAKNLNNFFALRNKSKMDSETLIMPILNNKYNNNFTYQIL